MKDELLIVEGKSVQNDIDVAKFMENVIPKTADGKVIVLTDKIKVYLTPGMKAVNEVTGNYMDVVEFQEVAEGDVIILSNKQPYEFIKVIGADLIRVRPHFE